MAVAPVKESGPVDAPPPISPSTSVLSLLLAVGGVCLVGLALLGALYAVVSHATKETPTPSTVPITVPTTVVPTTIPAGTTDTTGVAPAVPPLGDLVLAATPSGYTPVDPGDGPNGAFDLEGFLQFAENPRADRLAFERNGFVGGYARSWKRIGPLGESRIIASAFEFFHPGGGEGDRGVRERPHRARRRGRTVPAPGSERAPVQAPGGEDDRLRLRGHHPPGGRQPSVLPDGALPHPAAVRRDHRPHPATAGAFAGRELTHDEAMAVALEEAERAAADGDVPVGAVVIAEGRVVARRHNERESRHDPTAHAEVLALRDAAAVLGRWRLLDATVVVTLEPCPMCAGALVAARVGSVVFGATDPRAGACGSLYNLCADPRLNHEVAVTAGVRADESARLLEQFFTERRDARPVGSHPEGCESGRIGRSRKPLCPMGTVGSNPTPSALSAGAFDVNALVRADFSPFALSQRPSLAARDRWGPHFGCGWGASPMCGVRMGCQNVVCYSACTIDVVSSARSGRRGHAPSCVHAADRSRRVSARVSQRDERQPAQIKPAMAERCERRDRFNWPVVLSRRGGSDRPSDTYGVIRSSGPRAFAISAARVDLQLAVSVRQVGLDGAERQEQSLSDLPVRRSATWPTSPRGARWP